MQVEEKKHVQFKQIFTNNLFLQVSFFSLLFLFVFSCFSLNKCSIITFGILTPNSTSADLMQLHFLTDFLYF